MFAMNFIEFLWVNSFFQSHHYKIIEKGEVKKMNLTDQESGQVNPICFSSREMVFWFFVAARANHGSCSYHKIIIIFGGEDQDSNEINDIWKINYSHGGKITSWLNKFSYRFESFFCSMCQNAKANNGKTTKAWDSLRTVSWSYILYWKIVIWGDCTNSKLFMRWRILWR